MRNASIDRRKAFRAAAPLAGLLVAALLIWHGSYAAFTVQTSNDGNHWGTGTVALTNDGGTGNFSASTAGLFKEGNLTHGASGYDCLDVRVGGTLPGTLTLAMAGVSGDLAGDLNVTVSHAASGTSCANAAGWTQVYSGPLANASTSLNLGVAPNDTVAFRFTWSVGNGADEGATADANFVWTLTSN